MKKRYYKFFACILAAGMILEQAGTVYAAPTGAKDLLEAYKKNYSEQEDIEKTLKELPEKIRNIEKKLILKLQY